MKSFLLLMAAFGLTAAAALGLLIKVSGDGPISPAVDAQTLIDQLGHPDAETRRHAVQALGDMGADARDAIPALSNLVVHDANVGVRRYAACALGKIGASIGGSVPALAFAMQDKDRSVAREATEAVHKIEGNNARRAVQAKS